MLEYLKSYRSLACDYVRIIERMNERGISLLAEFCGKRMSIIISSFDELYISAIRLSCLNFAYRSSVRHADGGFDAHSFCRKRHALCVVARAACDYAGFLFLVTQSADFIICTSEFKTSGYLQIFGLQIDLILAAEMR